MNNLHNLSLAVSAIVLAAASTGASAACDSPGNLVVNCGFEATQSSNDFSGWTLTGNDVTAGTLGNLYGTEDAATAALYGDPVPHGGNYQAFFADIPSNATTLSQAITTVANTTYTVSFWLAENVLGPSDDNNSITASFGSGSYSSSAIAISPYTLITFTGVASGASTTLSMSFGTDAGEYYVDDISVTAPAPAVPEPSMPVLMGAGLLALGLLVRRKQF